jgi:putative SOS response-associated peptidase YedK
MCNDLANKIPWGAYVEEFSQTRIPIVIPSRDAAPNLEPREDIRPTDPAPILRPAAGGLELTQLRWGFRAARPKAPPVINFRSEGRTFTKGRCLVPVSWFYEFTGAKYPKTKWKFTVPRREWFCLAGLWREADGDWPESFTLLTTAPGPDMAPYHDREVVVLPRDRWEAWLDPEVDSASLIRSTPAGGLKVEMVSPGKEPPAEQPRLL